MSRYVFSSISEICVDPKQSTFLQTNHVWRQILVPSASADYDKLRAALEKLVADGKTFKVVSTDFDSGLYLTAKLKSDLAVSLDGLRKSSNVSFTAREPTPTYLETVVSENNQTVLVKSANKHNIMFCKVQPIDEIIADKIADGDLPRSDMLDSDKRQQLLAKKVGLRDDWIRHVMAFGPDGYGPNFLIDETKGVRDLLEVQPFLRTGYQNAVGRGPIAGEPVSRLRCNLLDLSLHADAPLRDEVQMAKAMEKLVKSAIMAAGPALMEPVYRVDIKVPEEGVACVYEELDSRRGYVNRADENGPLLTITGVIPVAEAEGFEASITSGKSVDCELVWDFSHYSLVPGSFNDRETLAGRVVAGIHESKGLTSKQWADWVGDKL